MISDGLNGVWFYVNWVIYAILLCARAAGAIAIGILLTEPIVVAAIASCLTALEEFIVYCVEYAILTKSYYLAMYDILKLPKRILDNIHSNTAMLLSVCIQLAKIVRKLCGGGVPGEM